jgi:biotin transporter BioY
MKIKYRNFWLSRNGFHESPFVKDEFIRKPKNLVVIEVVYFLLGFSITVFCASALFKSINSSRILEFTVLQLMGLSLALLLGLITCYAAIQLSLEQARFRKLFVVSAIGIIGFTLFNYQEFSNKEISNYLVFIDGSLIFILSIIFWYPPNRKYYEWTKLHS